MPLPHSHYIKIKEADINSGFVFKNLFIVDILSDKIDDKEKSIISNNLRKITSDTITLNINYEDNKIALFGILNKLKQIYFDISLTLHTKNDINIGKFIIKNCSIKYDFKDIIDFDWMKDNDIIGCFEVKYSYTDIIYSDNVYTQSKNYNKNHGCDMRGRYELKNPDKYIGDKNKICYLSSFNKKLFNFYDTNSNVSTWTTETLFVYDINGEKHTFYPDLCFEKKTEDNKVEKFAVQSCISKEKLITSENYKWLSIMISCSMRGYQLIFVEVGTNLDEYSA